MLKKISQFSGKSETQHLNLSESFCWVSLGVLLGFLTSTQPTVEFVGWANKYVKENLSIPRKSETQHLNLSESFCWVSLGVLLGFVPQPNLR
jgi:hypothetical protein